MATRVVNVGMAVVVGALLVGVGVAAGRRTAEGPRKVASRSPATTATTSAATMAPAPLVEFRDDRAGWSISYPKVWSRLAPKEADVALVVAEQPLPGANSGGSILARTVTLAAAVDESNLAAAREITDSLVQGEGIQLLDGPRAIRQAGLPGYFYFYSFKDPATGQAGVHTHYFLFKGTTMISFVFQALPEESFPGLAGLFDEVLGSFRVR